MSHGFFGTKLYNMWSRIKYNCLNSNSPQYKYYKDSGITLCEEWYNFEKFKDWALANGYKEGLRLALIYDDSSYSPNNCIFIKQLKCIHRLNFIKKSTELYDNKYTYDIPEYFNLNDKIKIICPQHGEFYKKRKNKV